MIAALLREREGYERYGRDDRVAEVDAELAKIGYQARTPAQRATKMAPAKRGDFDQRPGKSAEADRGHGGQ